MVVMAQSGPTTSQLQEQRPANPFMGLVKMGRGFKTRLFITYKFSHFTQHWETRISEGWLNQVESAPLTSMISISIESIVLCSRKEKEGQ
jgi:hypothetical protein